MTSRERVARTIRFENPDRMPYQLVDDYGTDFAFCGMWPNPDDRPRDAVDEWGAVWESIGGKTMGEVKHFPLSDWGDFDKLNVPDIHDPKRWEGLAGARERAGDLFLVGSGISIYERVHFIRGLENTWRDIYEEPDKLGALIDILVDMNIAAIERYADEGVDGIIWPDDWGLQYGMMIDPAAWCRVWQPRYARVYAAAHDAGMLTFLHSCGHIVDILDPLIDAGLDVIHMDQQENMGLELLGERFGGRLTFFNPVDIQKTMARGNLDEIRAYCRKMVAVLGRPEGGFIARAYGDRVGAGHTEEAVAAMCEEFLAIANEQQAA